jgi:LCP family protein required for cell wall assembly
MTSLVGAAMYAFTSVFVAPVTSTKATVVPPNKHSDSLNKRINILLLGLDDGDNEIPGSPRRSDAMMVASINSEDSTIKLLSLPRDTKVNIPSRKGYDKITHAFFYGGSDLATRTVEDFLHITINYYVVIDWQAFIKVIDILGGVDLYVERDMDYEDPYANLRIHLLKGYQHLDGQKSGEYVRFRHDELGDIGRVQRQQRFLKALSDQVFHAGIILKMPALVNTINKYVETDMNLLTMLKLTNTLKSFHSTELQTEMIPGSFATIDGLSYWMPDREQTRLLVEKMLMAETAKVSGVYHE